MVKEFTREIVTVLFESVAATVALEKHLFTVFDVNLKRDVASRKVQGMTLDM